MNNGYPLELIFKLFNLRIKKLLSTKIPPKIDDNNDHENTNKIISNMRKKFFVYFRTSAVTQSATCMISRSVYNIGYRCINKLNRFIKVHKNKKEHDNNNVIYKIWRNNCDASYVGQTKRNLKT